MHHWTLGIYSIDVYDRSMVSLLVNVNAGPIIQLQRARAHTHPYKNPRPRAGRSIDPLADGNHHH